ncbi:MAG: endonuclease MutS2 [Dethiobacteria bacterium]|jgi:DNA mismatch repair protein MutS2
MEKTMHFLEFKKIRQQLQNFTLTGIGAQKAALLKPSSSYQKVRDLQQETSEALQLILQKKLPFKECGDLLPALQRAGKGGVLSPAELTEILHLLKSIEALRASFFEDNMAERFPHIFKLVSGANSLDRLQRELERCLASNGEVKDQASSLLASLRREVKNLENSIRQTMDSYVRSQQYRKYLQENIVTLRSNRYVLPVKQEFRNYLPGIVHDQSASGMTLFIEPFPVVELNNRLRETKSRLEEEIERILRELTALVAVEGNEVATNYRIYGELDFILARGYLSLALKGRQPLINEDGYIHIKGGRHPFLPPEEVIPLDINIGKGFHTLVITGPNTGGKTVALKTVGLFCLMSQCGLHLPAGEGTEISVFEKIFADIGDEQNIEQSLSTFSGHMANIIHILHNVRPLSLVLIDELGAGTDPSEGSALAMAILEELHSRGVRTIATTHINELKVFAHLQEGMENASMEFDLKTLSPTFRLLIGVPGQSNALTIVERLGMSSEVVGRARAFLQKDFLNLEEVLADLVKERQRLTQDTEKMEEMKWELNFRLLELEREINNLRQKKKEILDKARQETGEIIRMARKKTDEIIKKLHRAEREERGKRAFVLGEETRQELKTVEEELEKLEPWKEEESCSPGLQDIKEGQTVYLKKLRCYGEVLRIDSEEEIQVQAGALKVNTVLADIQAYRGNKVEKRGNVFPPSSQDKISNIMWEKSASVSPRLDLRGLTLEEAVTRVEKHLDDCILAGLDKIEIIHGKGTGKLRQGLHRYLDEEGYVEKYRLGVEGEGGSGVTIVNLKKG